MNGLFFAYAYRRLAGTMKSYATRIIIYAFFCFVIQTIKTLKSFCSMQIRAQWFIPIAVVRLCNAMVKL